MENGQYQNHWKKYHDSLDGEISKTFKAEIERVLGLSQSAFYSKIKYPDKYLTIAEKWAIAKVYNLTAVFLFPELEG